MTIARFTAGLLCFPALLAAADLHRFVDQNGKILAAEAVSLADGHVTLKTQDGNTLDMVLSQLSEVDQKFLHEKFPAVPINMGNISLEWKAAIAPNSGRAQKFRQGSYQISESQVMDFSVMNKGDQLLDNLTLGCRIYLCGLDGQLDPDAKSALNVLQRVYPLKPKEKQVIETPAFNVSDVVTGSSPDIQITQEQRKRIKGIIAVVFQNDQPIYQLVTPGLEEIQQRIGFDKDGMAISLRRLFPRTPK